MALLEAAAAAAGGAPQLVRYLAVNRNLHNKWSHQGFLPRHARVTLRLALGLLRPLRTAPDAVGDMATDPSYQEVWRQVAAIWRARNNTGDDRWDTLTKLLNALEPPGRTSRRTPGTNAVNSGTNQDNP